MRAGLFPRGRKGWIFVEYLIGVDLGTSGTKTVLFDVDGNVVASKTIEYPLYQEKNGWAEQDPLDWWNAAADTIRAVVTESGVNNADIKGLGISGQMHGLVMLDRDGNVLRRSIIWCDQRTAKECEEITARVGAKRLIEITANPALTGFTASKILWVRNNEPEIYEKCAHILLPKDYVRYMLTGDFATEVSDASGMQLLDVVNETLEISRMEAGHVQLAEAECSLSELVLQARMDMVDLADRADVTLACDIEPLAHDRVLVDAVRLSHVLTQLVDNAIKYSPAGSTVRISVAENAGAPQGFASFRFVVADKGVGMEPAFMERMFMPFERESNTTASGVQGTGLGLTIVRNVLDLMEGELAVESAPGEGSTFTVDITFRQAPADVAAEVPRPSRGRGPVHRILLVEDNELNREIAVEILHEYGFLVDTAENGAIAVDKVRSSPADRYDLVLMDIQMPVMDGYTATQRIRALNDPARAAVPIVAMTANVFEEERKRAFDCGMNAFLSKPLVIDALIATLRDILH